MFGHPVPGFSPDDEGRATADAAYRPLVDAVARCQRAGVLTGTDPERVALHLWALAHGMVSLELNDQLPDTSVDVEQLYAEALALAAQPFLSTPAPPEWPRRRQRHR